MTPGNITIDPSAFARAVRNPEIKEVRNIRSGLILDARRFIERKRYDRLVQIRNIIIEAMKRDTPRIVCAICGVPVYLVSRLDKTFFFRHKIEDGSCPAQTRSSWSEREIRAMKYHGARESNAHKKIKNFIERSLRADSRVSYICKEKNWRSAKNSKTFRRPDVQAVFNGRRLAFEAQLTTTFLDVVVGRRIFYRDQKALLIWVLRRFDPNYRRLTEDDLLFTNNSNVLVVDEETTTISEVTQRCIIRCFYREPFLIGTDIREKWKTRLIGLDELQLDFERQRAFWFDFERKVAEAEHKQTQLLEKQRREGEEHLRREREAKANQLRADIFDFWERKSCWDIEGPDDNHEWLYLRHQLAEFGVRVPEHHKTCRTFRSAVSSLLSAKLGRPVGFRYNKLVEIAHYLAEWQKEILWIFGWALRTYSTATIMEEQDRSGRWKKKKRRIQKLMKSRDPEYKPDQTWTGALKFLFPEVADKFDSPLYQ